MAELFKTILILSLIGFALTLVLLCLKPFTAKKFPAIWQYCIWLVVLFCMVIPIYKFIPESTVKNIPIPSGQEFIDFGFEVDVNEAYIETENLTENVQKSSDIDVLETILHILPFIWLSGCVVFLAFAFSSYFIYLFRKSKHSQLIENKIFESVKKELGITRKIHLYTSSDITSPVLVGVLFPRVYIPEARLDDESLKMVFLHELTHYKRRDLLIKWFSLFVNAIHWFNPLSYILCRNISDSCEILCDVTVTKNMSEDEQKLYMKTILDFAVWRRDNV